MIRFITLLAVIVITSINPSLAQYLWFDQYDTTQAISNRIPPPDGYKRIDVETGSFQQWLRNLPLKEGNPSIHLYNGKKKFFQMANYAVIDIDVGDKDLQQCADTAIRLRSEYFYSKGQYDSIAFNFTSGDRFRYADWLKGITPVVTGNDVSWKQQGERENSRAVFKEYLEILFTYAGSYSLSEELTRIDDINDMRIGDLFVEGGFPGHVVMVMDIAENIEDGRRAFLLAQGYNPAQDMHIIKNPVNWSLSPWFKLNFGDKLYTLEWVFEKEHLMRFK